MVFDFLYGVLVTMDFVSNLLGENRFQTIEEIGC